MDLTSRDSKMAVVAPLPWLPKGYTLLRMVRTWNTEINSMTKSRSKSWLTRSFLSSLELQASVLMISLTTTEWSRRRCSSLWWHFFTKSCHVLPIFSDWSESSESRVATSSQLVRMGVSLLLLLDQLPLPKWWKVSHCSSATTLTWPRRYPSTYPLPQMMKSKRKMTKSKSIPSSQQLPLELSKS